MVEHAAVNRVVVGSSPTFGAISIQFKSELSLQFYFSFKCNDLRNVESSRRGKKFESCLEVNSSPNSWFSLGGGAIETD